MADVRISAQSKEYIRVQVVGKEAGSYVDPTSDSVYLAFLSPPNAIPQSGDWKAASWETDATVTPHAYYARLIVGIGSSIPLSVGTYFVWIKLVDTGGEVPVRYVGNLIVE